MDQELPDLEIKPAAYRAELDHAIANGQLVTRCWTPTCRQMRLASWPKGQWVESPSELLAIVSHGICPACAQLLDFRTREYDYDKDLYT